MNFVYSDGGRELAGYKGSAGDCVTRAISIANEELNYQDVYKELHERTKIFADTKRSRKAKSLKGKSKTARNGVFKEIYEPYLFNLGWVWEPTMQIGSGTTVHVKQDELPEGKLILRLSGHIVCVDDGVIYDTYDCSRDGTRCVYGFYQRLSESIRNELV